MIYSRNYARVFVTLKQESSDFSSDFKEAMGRCVIEVRFGKGRFSAYIQGLKKGCYSIFVVSCKEGKNVGIKIGDIHSDMNGKGELKTDFNPENLCDFGLKMEDFHVVAVMPYMSKSVNPILTGYIGGVIQWKNDFTFLNTETDADCNKNYEEKVIENDTCKDEVSNNVDTDNEKINNDILNDENYSNDDKKIDAFEENNDVEEKLDKNEYAKESENKENEALANDTVKKEACVCKDTIENIEKNNDIFKSNKNQPSENFNDIIKKFKKGIEKIENKESKTTVLDIENFKQKKKNRNYAIDYIFANNVKMTPFQHQKRNVEWVRADLSELVVFPGKTWVYLNNPFVSFSEKKYKHLILGRYFDGDKEKYLLGVPGRYINSYRLEAGMQGFKQFKCCENKMPSEGDYGYWILNIEY